MGLACNSRWLPKVCGSNSPKREKKERISTSTAIQARKAVVAPVFLRSLSRTLALPWTLWRYGSFSLHMVDAQWAFFRPPASHRFRECAARSHKASLPSPSNSQTQRTSETRENESTGHSSRSNVLATRPFCDSSDEPRRMKRSNLRKRIRRRSWRRMRVCSCSTCKPIACHSLGYR